MKITFVVLLFVGISCCTVSSQSPKKPFRPATAGIQDSLNPPAEFEFTPAELATPPAGQIQKRWLRAVNNQRNKMTAVLAAVPAGSDGQASPWFAKAQAYKNGLDVVAASSLQSDCFAQIPRIADVLAARVSDAPKFASETAGLANGFSPVLLCAIERHIIDQAGTVSAETLTLFVKVFSTRGFISEGDWEAEPIPIDHAGIMILDPVAVVAHLKTQPWEDAERLVGSVPGAEAFDRYDATGNGLAILKTKYAANKASIIAKWNELAAWVETKRPTN